MAGFRGDVPAARAAADEIAAAIALSMLDGLEQPIVACDRAGRLVLSNGAARSMCGLRPAMHEADFDAIGFADARGERVPSERHPLKRALDGEMAVSEQLWLIDCSGERAPVLVNAWPLLDGAGIELGAAMAISPTGDGSRAEERLRNYASDIEILVEVSRLLSELHDADEAAAIICTVATGATGAIAVLLWRLVDGDLTMTCHECAVDPAALPELEALARRGASRALTTALPVVDEDAAESLVVDRIAIPLGTAWHEPLISGGETTGVLSVLWPGLLEDPERPRSLIGLLGHHAATALERADLLRRLRQAARTDALTGTANRRVWQESLDRELMRAGRAHQPLSVVLIDLDNFKAYNDRHGHPQGDRLLQDAAVAWAGQLRAADLLARMGGEEFAVMLPDTDLDGALVVAERLRASVPDGQTCSIGVVACESPATSSELYSTADAALYRAKQAGRNRIEVGVLAGLSAEPL